MQLHWGWDTRTDQGWDTHECTRDTWLHQGWDTRMDQGWDT